MGFENGSEKELNSNKITSITKESNPGTEEAEDVSIPNKDI